MLTKPIAGGTVESGRVTKTTVLVTLLCSFIMVADSYDVAALSFAAPELISKWHIDKFAIGTVFSASLFGLLVGSIVFGFIGDRFGRKTAIIAGCILFSLLTAATGLASNY